MRRTIGWGAAVLLLLATLLTATAVTARPAAAAVIYGPQCSEFQDGHVIWIQGIKYTCTKTRYGWWYIAYWYGCGAKASVPGRVARTC